MTAYNAGDERRTEKIDFIQALITKSTVFYIKKIRREKGNSMKCIYRDSLN